MPRFRDGSGFIEEPKPTVPEQVAQGRRDFIPHETETERAMRDPETRAMVEWEQEHQRRTLPRRLRFAQAVENLQRHAAGQQILPGFDGKPSDVIVDGLEPEPVQLRERVRRVVRRRPTKQ